MTSGEEVPYLERPAAATGMPTQRTIVLLHGITTDATGLAFAIEPLTAALGPDVRLLAPDAPGHGASRSQWVQHVDLIGNSMWRGFDRDAHVSDLEAFLVAAVACRGPRTRERLARAQRIGLRDILDHGLRGSRRRLVAGIGLVRLLGATARQQRRGSARGSPWEERKAHHHLLVLPPAIEPMAARFDPFPPLPWLATAARRAQRSSVERNRR